MGTRQFQTEYIDYLENRNTELLKRINSLKENYENKIFAKDLNKQYLISALDDVLNVCSTISGEIDSFFDKMTAAMSEFKNILLRKSEMVQLVDKISKVINPIKTIDDLVGVDDSTLMKEQYSEARVGNKIGPFKVCQSINGPAVSKNQTVYLKRMQEMFTPDRKSGGHQLSPIIEASPDTSSDPSNSEGLYYKKNIIALEKLNPNKLPFMSEESPKSRFKGPKTWKKSISSNKYQSDLQKNTVSHENNENLNLKYSLGEVGNANPLEGPSWMYKEIPEKSLYSNQFIDYQRRKHRFGRVFDENCTNFEKKSKKSLEGNSNEFDESYEQSENEDFEGSRKKVSESSEDFISESFTSENEDDDSFKREKSPSSKRKLAKKTNRKNDVKVVKSLKEVSIINSEPENRTNTFNTPTYSGSSAGENNEENSIHQSVKRKNSLGSSFNKFCLEQFNLKKTPNRISRIRQETRLSNIRKITKKKNTSNPDKLENCGSAEEIIPKKSTTKKPREKKKSENSKSEIESKSPLHPETEGRKRRKAAPSFKLVEPKLKSKLRRS